jgi:hypothetical protein
MARKTIKRPASAAKHSQFQPQDLLLAGIGAVSLGRKQVIEAYANGFEGVAELRSQAEHAVQSAAKTFNGKVIQLRKQAEAKATPLAKKVIKLADEAKAQAKTRLAPVLAKFGVKKAPARRPAAKTAKTAKKRAPAKKKPAARSRKAA